jgi:sulfonate transport system substrate-binding protein
VADLRGKRVGYVRGTTSHLYLYQQLKEAGLSFDDIKPVNLSPADGLSAFARGDIDAWAIYGYNGQLARTRHGARILKTAVGYLSGNFLIYANPKAVQDVQRQAALADLLQRLQKPMSGAMPTFWTTPRPSPHKRACRWVTWSKSITTAARTAVFRR